jgi:hypothetical protein
MSASTTVGGRRLRTWVSRPGFWWRALALGALPAALLAATALPAILLSGRLPRLEAAPRGGHPTGYVLMAVVFASLVASGWAALAAVVAGTPPARSRRRKAWELGLPLLGMVGGAAAALADLPVMVNLDRSAGIGLSGGAVDLLAACAAVLAGGGLALLAGRRAAAAEPDDRPRGAVRAVWLRDVSAGPSWWTMQAMFGLVLLAALVVPSGLAGDWAGGLGPAVVMLAFVGLLVVYASNARVAVSTAGVRVRLGVLAPVGAELPIRDIRAVDVVALRSLPWRALWCTLPPRLVLRGGPALVIRTRAGGRCVITVPDADEAAGLLRGWLAARAVGPPEA